MATKMANQVDLTPATFSSGLHFHAPNGQSAGAVNNPSDSPNAAANANVAKAVTVKVTGTQGATIRFSNPS